MSPARWISMVVGFWVAFGAFLGFAARAYSWTDLLAGAVFMGTGMALANERAPEGWAILVLGCWLATATLIPGLHYGAGLLWNNVVIGVLVTLLALVPAAGRTTGGRAHLQRSAVRRGPWYP